MIALLLLQASAHDAGISNAHWRITRQGVTARVRISARDADALAAELGSVSDLAAVLPMGVSLSIDGQPCQPGPARTLPARSGWLHYTWSLRCPQGSGVELSAPLLTGIGASHLHLVSLDVDEEQHRLVLTAAHPVWPRPLPVPGRRRGGTLLLISVTGLIWMASGRTA